ncbi:MAG: metallophosphoesterase [Spirochaetota bacterium]
MKILALTDIHGKKDTLKKIASEIKLADVVVISGDLTHFGRISEAASVVASIGDLNENLVCVAGNCDYPEIDGFLIEEGLSVHGRHRCLKDIFFAGVSGSLAAPVETPNTFTEAEFQGLLKNALSGIEFHIGERPLIFVSHQPAYRTKADKVMGLRHVGSRAIRSFIEENHPIINFSGHIHEARCMDTLLNTIIINPGPWKEGHYAQVLFETSDAKPVIHMKRAD